MQKRSSLAINVGLLSALLSTITALLILVTALFFYQKVLGKNLISQVETNISKVNNFILGFLYAQDNWIHLEENQKFLNSLPNVSYTYIQNPSHIIDFGVLGLKSPEIGLSQPPWEPKLVNQEITPQKYCFFAPRAAVDILGNRVRLGEQICVLTSPIKYNNTVYGYIRIAVNFRQVNRSISQLMLFALLLSFLVGIAVAACVTIATRRYFLPIRQLSQKMNSIRLLKSHLSKDFTCNSQLLEVTMCNSDPEETAFLKSSLTQFLEVITESEKLKRDAILTAIANQVAHDIRSPLAALEIIMADLYSLPEKKRVIIRSAVNRIRDIANNLLDRNREIQKGRILQITESLNNSEPTVLQLLSSIVDSIITEKRMQFRSLLEIEIETQLQSDSYGLFASVQPSEFKRVLSNLINNAVEAMEKRRVGRVVVSLYSNHNNVFVKVTDNGKGMSPEVLHSLLQSKTSFGKAKGNGLGLYHAKTSVENWGGLS